MKKIIVLASALAIFSACNEQTETEMTTEDTSFRTAPVTTEAYSPGEGDVTYRENRVQVWRGGAWEDTDEEVRMDNGVVITREGRAVRDGREIEMEDGAVVSRDGDVFDRTGRALENAWESTKEAGKDAGRAIGDAAQKAGRKIEGAVDDTPND